MKLPSSGMRDKAATALPPSGSRATEVGKKYRPTVEVLDVAQTSGRTALTGQVSGDFPGPIDLRDVFTVTGGKIERLEIS